MQNKISQDAATSPTVVAQERVGSSLPSWLFPIVCVWGCVYPFVGERLVTACNEVSYPAPHGKMFPPPEYLEAVVRAMTVNTAIGYGVCGSLFFLVLAAIVGAASGMAHAMRGAVIGAMLGFLIPGAAGGIGHRIENYLLQADMDGMLRTVLVLRRGIHRFCTDCWVGMEVGRQASHLGTRAWGDFKSSVCSPDQLHLDRGHWHSQRLDRRHAPQRDECALSALLLSYVRCSGYRWTVAAR